MAAGFAIVQTGFDLVLNMTDPAKIVDNVAHGHSFSHWSQYVAAGSSFVGVVIAISAHVIGNKQLLAAGVFFATTSLCSWYFLKTFVPLRALEAYTIQLRRQITLIREELIQTEKCVEQLGSVRQGYERHFIKADRLANETNSRLTKILEKLFLVAEKLDSSDKVLENMQQYCNDHAKVCEDLRQVCSELVEHQTHEMAMFAGFSRELDRLAREREVLLHSLQRGDQHTATLQRATERLTAEMIDLRSRLGSLEQVNRRLNSINEGLDAKVRVLDGLVTDAGGHLSRMKRVDQVYARVLAESADTRAGLQALTTLVERYAAMKAGKK